MFPCLGYMASASILCDDASSERIVASACAETIRVYDMKKEDVRVDDIDRG